MLVLIVVTCALHFLDLHTLSHQGTDLGDIKMRLPLIRHIVDAHIEGPHLFQILACLLDKRYRVAILASPLLGTVQV